MGILFYIICCFSLAVFNIFSLEFMFFSLINMCLSVFHLGFMLYGTLCGSWTCVAISFPMSGKFLTIISSNIFSDPISFSSSSGTPIIRMLLNLICPRGLWDCPHFFSVFFLYSIPWQLFSPFYLPVHLSVLLPQLFCYWFLLVYFSFQLLCCSSLFVCCLVLVGPC